MWIVLACRSFVVLSAAISSFVSFLIFRASS